MIRRIFRKLLYAVRKYYINRTKKIAISSNRASLNAAYGKNVSVGKGTYIGADVTIGDHSYINHSSSLECCDVGRFCSISSYVFINPYEHLLSGLSTSPFFLSRKEVSLPARGRVVIGNDVLVSLHAVILHGVKIGNGAVIGAGAVVTHDVGDYEIVGGVPARHIGWRFDEPVRNAVASSKWWEKSDEFLKSLPDSICESMDVVSIERHFMQPELKN